MEKMIALKNHRYNRADLQAGDTFEADPRHVRVLVALRNAAYATRDMVALTEQAGELDTAGEAWNPFLHTSTKMRNNDGTWRKRPGARVVQE